MAALRPAPTGPDTDAAAGRNRHHRQAPARMVPRFRRPAVLSRQPGPAAAAGRAPCAAGAAPANHSRTGGSAHHRAAGSAGVHPLSGRLPLDSRLWSQPDLPAFRHPQIQLLLPHPASPRQNPEPAAGRGAAPAGGKALPAFRQADLRRGNPAEAAGPGHLHQQAEGAFLPAGMEGGQGNHFCPYVCGSGPAPLLSSQPAGPPVQSGGPEQGLGQRHHRAALCRWQALPVRCAGPILPQGPGSQGLLPE